jgi:hypothetical protein
MYLVWRNVRVKCLLQTIEFLTHALIGCAKVQHVKLPL